MPHFLKIWLLILAFTSPFALQAQLENYPDTLVPGRLSKVIISESAFYVGGLSFLSFIWYKDHERVPFHYYNDNPGWLQLDKAGHFYAAYYQSYFGYEALRWAGLSRKKALIYGAPLGLILQTPIEIFDGLFEGYGFSKGDMVANAAGPLLFLGQELLFEDQLVKPKFSYSPSGYAKYREGTLGSNHMESFFMDYNGHTYWLSTNLKSIWPKSRLPAWLNVAVGYSGNGMLGEFDNPEYYRGEALPSFSRDRQYIFSLDIDLVRIPTRSKFLRGLFKHLNKLKVPAPAIQWNATDRWKVHGIYF